MSVLSTLFYGFGIALQPWNLLACFIGVFIGTLVGVLPGIGPAGAMSLLLPVTFGMSPVTGIIMLAGIYYGTMYGGSTTSILVNIPGEAASIVTCLDGHQMALKGRAGPALGIAAFGSFIAGTASIIGLIFMTNALAGVALVFGPTEYFSLMCLGLSLVTYLTQGSILRGLVMAGVGLFLSQIGQDIVTGQTRFSFGLRGLIDGVGLVPVIMGLFGISEVLLNIETLGVQRAIMKTTFRHLFPTWEDWRNSAAPIGRGTIIGFFLGILPGGGALISSFVSYAAEKWFSKHPEEFGKGAIEGVAGPESANNAASTSGFIPLFSLGIPSNVIMALLLGALMIHGLKPGPLMITERPDVFWGTVASMYVGNAMLLMLNLPLIGLWVQVLKIPYTYLFSYILLFVCIGAYSLSNSVVDIYIAVAFGVIGYFMKHADLPAAPVIMGIVLGPMLETHFRRALIISNGAYSTFFTHPMSAVFLCAAILSILYPLIRWAIKRNRTVATKA